MYGTGTDTRFEHLQNRQSELGSSLVERMDKEYGEVREHLDKLRNETFARLETEVKDVAGQFSSVVATLDNNVSVLDDKMEHTVGRIDDQSKQLAKSMSVQLKAVGEQVNGAIIGANKRIDDLGGEAGQFVVEVALDKQITQAAVSRVDAKLGQSAQLLTKEVNDQKMMFKKVTAAFQKGLGQKQNSMEAQLQQLQQALEEAGRLGIGRRH